MRFILIESADEKELTTDKEQQKNNPNEKTAQTDKKSVDNHQKKQEKNPTVDFETTIKDIKKNTTAQFTEY